MKVDTVVLTIYVVTLTYNSDLSHWIFDNPENEDLADRIDHLESMMRPTARSYWDVYGDKSTLRFEFDNKALADDLTRKFNAILGEAQARFDASKENTDEC